MVYREGQRGTFYMTSVLREAQCKINLVGVLSVNYFPSVHSENLILTRRHAFRYEEMSSMLVKYIYMYIYIKYHLPLSCYFIYVCMKKIYMLRKKNKIKIPFPGPSNLSAYGYYTPTALLKCTPFENVINERVNYFQQTVFKVVFSLDYHMSI